MLSALLGRENIPHNVLNAKFHEKEAEIVANAGKPGAVTIATNMAGRGTDIVLGGSQRFKESLESWEEEEELIYEFKAAIKSMDLDKAEILLNQMPSQNKQKRPKKSMTMPVSGK